MTNEQREQIQDLRSKGLGYKKVAQMLSLPVGTVQSFCRRNTTDTASKPVFDEHHCRECGKTLVQKEKVKRRKFCSEECRIKWWTEHPCSKNSATKSSRTVVCACCNKPFTAYGKGERKYCSHDCYIKARFGGDAR